MRNGRNKWWAMQETLTSAQRRLRVKSVGLSFIDILNDTISRVVVHKHVTFIPSRGYACCMYF